MKNFFVLCAAPLLITSHLAGAQTPRCISLFESCYLQDSIELEHFLSHTRRNIELLSNMSDFYSATLQAEKFIEAQNELFEMQSTLQALNWAGAVLSAESYNFQPLQEYLHWLRQSRIQWGLDNGASPSFMEHLLSDNSEFEIVHSDGALYFQHPNANISSAYPVSEILRFVVDGQSEGGNWKATISPNGVDFDWAWDGFLSQTGEFVWRCRGKTSGQFLLSWYCSGQPRRDIAWPG